MKGAIPVERMKELLQKRDKVKEVVLAGREEVGIEEEKDDEKGETV